jgi:outer membrane protein assembly factor BamB
MPTRRKVVAGLLGGGILCGTGVYFRGSDSDQSPGLDGTETRNAPPTESPSNSSATWAQFQADGSHSGTNAASPLKSESPGLKWERPDTRPTVGPIVASEQYLLETRPAQLVAIDKATGDEVWNTLETISDSIGIETNPVIWNGFCVVGIEQRETRDQYLIGIELASGAESWRELIVEEGTVLHGLAMHDTRICVNWWDYVDERPHIRAIDLESRATEWTTAIEDYENVDQPVAISDESLVYTGYQNDEQRGNEPGQGDTPGGVTAVDPDTGSVRWRTRLGGTQTPATISNGRVIVTPQPGNGAYSDYQRGGPYPVFALDAESGAVQWKFAGPNTLSRSSPAVTDDTVYLGIDDTLFAVQTADGSLDWKTDLERDVDQATPIVVDDTVLVGDVAANDKETYLMALDRHSGERQWERKIEQRTIQDVISVDGEVFVKAATHDKFRSATVHSYQ